VAVSQIDPLLRDLADTWVDAAKARDPAALFRTVYPLTFSERWIRANQETLDLARERYQALDFEAFVHLMESFLALDITDRLHEIRAPALIAVGEDDILKPRKYAEIIAGEIPDAEFAVIPHAGHAAMWEQAGVFNSLILGFLAKHSG
jgi:3-oxoadipate enol-lactonase